VILTSDFDSCSVTMKQISFHQKRMKVSFVIGTACMLSACFLQAQSQPIVQPGSPEWVETYKPPYKVPTELPADSALRKPLVELLRGKVTKQHRFSGSLKVYRNWAFFVGITVDQKGKSLKSPPMDNDDSVALWLRTREGWWLIDFRFGHSDAFYLVWPEKYGVPSDLRGMHQKKEAEGG
jgi:hypothetical protein